MKFPNPENGLAHSSAALLPAFQCFLLAACDAPPTVADEPASEPATNVTLSEAGTGRFYGTQDTENCWTDILSQEQIGAADSLEYRISGVLYGVAPLAELNGGSSISFADIRFASQLSRDRPK